jgi:pyruvate/2-oxoacid:ferredoxin oxidoreductase alpha subunit
MRKALEGSQAIAQAVALCRPQVIAAYPITPQTHIVENIAKLVADGKLNCEYVSVESEFSAASVVLGAALAGSRTYTASASQGILLMAEVLFNIAGSRVPIVMTCANRAVSAPLSIWNDQQDSMAVRDAGWIQLYCADNQEAVDTTIQAYRIAERTGGKYYRSSDAKGLQEDFRDILDRFEKSRLVDYAAAERTELYPWFLVPALLLLLLELLLAQTILRRFP